MVWGHAKTEQAAKNELLAKAHDWLRLAGLQDGKRSAFDRNP